MKKRGRERGKEIKWRSKERNKGLKGEEIRERERRKDEVGEN